MIGDVGTCFEVAVKPIMQAWPKLKFFKRYLIATDIPHSMVGVFFDGPRSKKDMGIYKVVKPYSLFTSLHSFHVSRPLRLVRDGKTLFVDSDHFAGELFAAMEAQVVPSIELHRDFAHVVETVRSDSHDYMHGTGVGEAMRAWCAAVEGDFDQALEQINGALEDVERYRLQRILSDRRYQTMIECKRLILNGSPAAIADYLRSLELEMATHHKVLKIYRPTVFPFETKR